VNENAVVVGNRMKADGSNPVTLAEFCGKLDQYVSSGSEVKIGQPQARIVLSMGLIGSTKNITIMRQKQNLPFFSRARWVK